MAAIEPAGMVAVRLDPLRKLRARDDLSDEDMARVQRAWLIEPSAPNPSVELLLHAFMPHAFVDHTHANAVLSLIDQPDGAKLCEEVYDGRMGLVPYVRPGFGLAKAAATTFDKNPKVEGLILDKHGIFTFGASAKESYERMIELVSRAEERLKKNRKAVFVTAQLPQQVAPNGDVAPIVRGACSLKNDGGEGAHRRMIAEFRTNDAILNFVNGAELQRYGASVVITPDYAIRTKRWPLILPAPEAGKLDEFKSAAAQAVAPTSRATRNISRATTPASAAASACSIRCPASCWCRALAFTGWAARPRTRASPPISRSRGRDHHRCRGDRPLQTDHRSRHFDTEYWPIEQAKLGKKKSSRWRARSRPSPAPEARSARRPPRRLPMPAPRSPCSTSTRPWPPKRPRRSAARRRGDQMRRHRRRVRAAFAKIVAISAASISWSPMPAPGSTKLSFAIW